MDEALKSEFAPVKNEICQLLLSAYCYERKFNRLAERMKDESREFMLEEYTALRHLSNGVVLHICNLDDESSTWSIRSMTKSMGKVRDYARLTEECAALLKKYRIQINAFKTKYRNQFIAHRNAEDYPDPLDLPDYRGEFREIVQTALSALQGIWGSSIYFGFKLGSRDRTLDFKEALGLV